MYKCVKALLLLFCVVSICSCSDKERNWKETYPITGEVYVDGQPAAELSVTLHDVKGLDSENPTLTSAMTDATGKFSASTYEAGDGAPEGTYILTFSWGKLNPISMSFEDDKLKGKFNNPEESKFQVTVSAGEPTDMGRIELKTR